MRSDLLRLVVALPCLILVGSFFAEARSADEQPLYKLMYKFKPNKIVHYDVSQSMEITSQKDNLTQSSNNMSDTRVHYRVIAVEKGQVGVLEPIIDSVKIREQDDEEIRVVFDSTDSKSPPPQYRGIRSTIGRPLSRFRIAANGRFIERIPLDNQVVPANDVATDDPNQNFLVVLPEEPIRVGESWKEKFHAKVTVPPNLKRSIALLRKYTLESVDGNRARISLSTAVLDPTNDPVIQLQIMQMQPTGTIIFDLDEGMIVERTLNTDETVIGGQGDNSSLRAVSKRVERLVPLHEVAQKKRRTTKTK